MSDFPLAPSIPDLTGARKKKKGYREHPIDPFTSLYEEDLVDVRDCRIEGANHYWVAAKRPQGAIQELLVRETIALKLELVDLELIRHGYKLYVKDAYRPLEVQHHVQKIVAEKYGEKAPDYAAFVSDSTDSPPPHLTGGAVDVELTHVDGTFVEMGKKLREGMPLVIHPDFFDGISRDGIELTSDEEKARLHRAILHHVMTSFGFVCNPTEYWHFSWGDQMWAKLAEFPTAFYGPAQM